MYCASKVKEKTLFVIFYYLKRYIYMHAHLTHFQVKHEFVNADVL